MQRPPSVSTLPPDGGWGWVIVIASGIASGFPAGFHRSVTLFYYELLKVFRQSATSTATVMSVDTVVGALTSPLAGALCNRFGCRVMAMVGGAFIALAFFTSAFVPTLFYFYFTFSIFRGFGTTVFAVARISVVNLYFDRNKGKANAMSAMFYSLGSVYMAPLVTVLFAEYGLHGALVICSALMLHVIPAAALFRPLPELEPVPKEALDDVGLGLSLRGKGIKDDGGEGEEGVGSKEESCTQSAAPFSPLPELKPGPMEPLEHVGSIGEAVTVREKVTKGNGDKEEEGMESQGGSDSQSVGHFREITELLSASLHEECPGETITVSEIEKVPDCNRHRDSGVPKVDVVSQKNIINTSEEDSNCQTTELDGSQPLAATDVQCGVGHVSIQEEITLLPPFPNKPGDTNMSMHDEHALHTTHNADMSNEHCGTPVTARCAVRQRSVLEQCPDPGTIEHRVHAVTYMKNTLRVFTGGVLQDSTFLLYCLFMSSYAYTHAMTFTFLSGIAIEKGCIIEQCTVTMAVMSGIEIPLRLSYGFAFDLKAVRPRRPLVFGVCGCLIGILVCTLPLFPGRVTVLVIWAVQQSLAGVIVCQWSTVMCDILPRNQLTSGFGVLRFFMGVGGLLAPITGGAMRDGSGTYSLVYYVAGTQLFILSVVFLIYNIRRSILGRTHQETYAA